ncbi:hypothetical protein [Reyranella sp.]|uniref:hypothetical protein n=1 Tax=Reyranella sp. TaxID=1929291 RepID=UPI0037836B83
MPIAKLIITDAAIRIGIVFARVAAIMSGAFPFLRQPARIMGKVKCRARTAPSCVQQAACLAK